MIKECLFSMPNIIEKESKWQIFESLVRVPEKILLLMNPRKRGKQLSVALIKTQGKIREGKAKKSLTAVFGCVFK